jgi:glycosyltransferase involved in cell wall biosynthesis
MTYTGVCALYCLISRARLVFHIAHDDDVRRPSFKGWGPKALGQRIERVIAEFGLRRAHAIVAQTQDQADALAANYGLRASLVVPNFHPAPANDGGVRRHSGSPFRVTWVANFKASKNPEIFVDLAASFADDPRVQFVMIGRPGKNEQYAALHKRIDKLPNLTYMGELPVDQVNEQIAQSHIFVNTSTAEGFPNTFIQAWFRSVPVVSCFVDPDRCLSSGKAGIFVEHPSKLADAVGRLIEDRSMLDKLAESAREYGYAHHGFGNAASLVELLRSNGVP